ncbi:MAG: hypothetical protein ACFFEE_04025, partial [Candidatus Thorarchaeota archaeon]
VQVTVLALETEKDVPGVKSEESVVAVSVHDELFTKVPENETERGDPVPTYVAPTSETSF